MMRSGGNGFTKFGLLTGSCLIALVCAFATNDTDATSAANAHSSHDLNRIDLLPTKNGVRVSFFEMLLRPRLRTVHFAFSSPIACASLPSRRSSARVTLRVFPNVGM